MALVRRDPFRELHTFQDAVSRFFNQAFNSALESPAFDVSVTGTWLPAVDIHETADDIVLRAELPGLKREEIKVELEDRLLTISGEKKEDTEVKRDNYHHVERRYGRFLRSFTLPANVNRERIAASMRDGILELKLPKAEEAKPRQIPVQWD